MKRNPILIYTLGLLAAVLLSAGSHTPAAAMHQPVAAPPGFYSISSAPGVDLYRKDYSGGSPDYILTLALNQGARLTFLTGSSASSNGELLAQRQPLAQYWSDFSAAASGAQCVLNGAVFDPGSDPARLPLGLKVDGQVLSPGLGAAAAPGEYLQLEVSADHAGLTALGDLSVSAAENILGGQALSAVQDGETPAARTLAGIDDANGDGVAETLLFLVSETTTISAGAQVLTDFGADQMLALGGGDAAQIICQGQAYIASESGLPQAIGVTSAQTAEYAAAASDLSQFPIVVAGQSTSLNVTVKNTGVQAWQAGEVALINQRDPLGATTNLTIMQSVAPGETAQVSWQTEVLSKTGIYTTQWDIMRSSASISDRPLTISVVVIPEELEARKAELEAQVRDWVSQKMENVQTLILEWIEAQVRKGFESLLDSICPSAALLPGLLFAFAWILHRKLF